MDQNELSSTAIRPHAGEARNRGVKTTPRTLDPSAGGRGHKSSGQLVHLKPDPTRTRERREGGASPKNRTRGPGSPRTRERRWPRKPESRYETQAPRAQGGYPWRSGMAQNGPGANGYIRASDPRGGGRAPGPMLARVGAARGVAFMRLRMPQKGRARPNPWDNTPLPFCGVLEAPGAWGEASWVGSSFGLPWIRPHAGEAPQSRSQN